MKKVVSMLLVLCMSLSLCAGCAKEKSTKENNKDDKTENVADKDSESETEENQENAVDTSEEVTIKLITIGDRSDDFDKVLEQINEKLKSKVNATLDVELYSWSDWYDKYPLAFASGEAFDLIYTSSWCYYSEQASKGGFLELTDELLQTYAPQTYADVTKDQWAETKISGKTYMVPITLKTWNNNQLALIRGDIREKYNIPEVTDLDSYLYFLEKVGEQDDIMAYNAGGSDGAAMIFRIFTDALGLVEDAANLRRFGIMVDAAASLEKGEVVFRDVLEDEEFMNVYKTMKELREKNVWSQNTLSNNTTADDAFQNGASASFVRGYRNIANVYTTLNESHPEWKLEIADIYSPELDPYANTCIADGIGVYANSKNPERALMVLDLLRYDQEIHELWKYGIEGENWETVGDSEYKILNSSYSDMSMGFSTSGERLDASYTEEIKEYFKRAQEAESIPYISFVFDSSTVKAECAAISAVADEYYPILMNGFADDIEATFREAREKAETAGLNVVLEEYTRQLEEYVAAFYGN